MLPSLPPTNTLHPPVASSNTKHTERARGASALPSGATAFHTPRGTPSVSPYNSTVPPAVAAATRPSSGQQAAASTGEPQVMITSGSAPVTLQASSCVHLRSVPSKKPPHSDPCS
eukprot:scaffold8641_cov134-Isochrysis_galbana.AAC.11